MLVIAGFSGATDAKDQADRRVIRGQQRTYMMNQRISPRAEYRRQESQRISESVTLAEKFGALKSLTVDLAHLDPQRHIKTSEMKYTVNLAHAKSLFRFDCPNGECVEGNFDLSAELANTVAARHTTATGELICQGWRSKATMDKVRCHNVLRYTLTVGY